MEGRTGKGRGDGLGFPWCHVVGLRCQKQDLCEKRTTSTYSRKHSSFKKNTVKISIGMIILHHPNHHPYLCLIKPALTKSKLACQYRAMPKYHSLRCCFYFGICFAVWPEGLLKMKSWSIIESPIHFIHSYLIHPFTGCPVPACWHHSTLHGIQQERHET